MARRSARRQGPEADQPVPHDPVTGSSPNLIDRRTALGLVGGAGALIALTGCGGGGDHSGTSTSTTRPGVVDVRPPVEPVGMPQLEAEVRDLHLRMVAAPATAEIVAGTQTDVLRFEAQVIDGDPASVTPGGSYLGPTLHVRTGQRVRVTFENQVSQESIVHWHGLVGPRSGTVNPPMPAAPARPTSTTSPWSTSPAPTGITPTLIT